LKKTAPFTMAKNQSVFDEFKYRNFFLFSLGFHVALGIFLLLPGPKSEPIKVLASLEFEFYDPLGGEPGGGPLLGDQPEAAPAPASAPEPEEAPEPEPEATPEPEPIEEEAPQVVESVSEEADEAPPPPPPAPPEKPKQKPKPKPKPAAKPQETPQNVAEGGLGSGDGTGTGTGQEGSGRGGVGGGTGRGNPDALAAYKTRVQRRLERNKKYPPTARSDKIEGVVYVTFTINKQGRVVNSFVARSSGHPILDDEAIGLLRRVNPLPTIPDEIKASAITLTAPLQFKIR
jgi:protein TonB